MKIGVLENLPDGGAKRVVYEQVKRLAEGHEVVYVRFNKSSVFDMAELVNDVVDMKLPKPSRGGLRRMENEMKLMTSWKRVYRKAADYFTDSGVDVVLAHPDYYTQAPLGLLYVKQPSVYYAEEWLRLVYEPSLSPVSELSGLKKKYEQLRRELLKKQDKKAVKRAGMVLVNSRFTKNNFIKAYDVEAEVLYPGVDREVFFPGEAGKKYFLFVGAEVDVNGFDLLSQVRAAYDVPFSVRTITPTAEGLRLSDAEMVRLYQDAVAVLCLSRGEPFGLAAIEAIACGVPVIAVNEGGYKETVMNGKTGLLIQRNEEELFSAMKKMASDKEMWQDMSRAGLKRVKQVFDWDVHVKKLEGVMEKVVHD